MQEELSGFTLIELVIIVSICGILGAIMWPQFTKWRDSKQQSLPAEDTRTPEQLVKDEFGVRKVGTLEGCSLYRYSNNEGEHFFAICPAYTVVKP
jgi:hypothetical protein